jgi:hypothetical protein
MNYPCEKLSYCILIDGLEVTIDNLLEELNSNTHLLIDNGKYKRIIKNLPTLCVFTNHQEDVNTFASYIGSFNEGSMSLFIMESFNSDVLKTEMSRENIINYANENSIIQIDVTMDGDAIEIESHNEQFDLLEICNIVCKSMLYPN